MVRYFNILTIFGASTEMAPTKTLPAGTSQIALSSSISTPATMRCSATLPSPPSPTADGVHLVNSINANGTEGSGFAWYRSAVAGDEGAQPNDYAVSAMNVYSEWECRQNRTGELASNITLQNPISSLKAVVGFFPDSDTSFWAYVNSTNASVNAAVGEASNGHRTFTVYKDDGRLLFTQNGSNFNSIYYCQ